MPRWASRLTLAVESIRVERLQDISEEDARAEGVEPIAITFCDDHEGRPHIVPSLGGPYRDGLRVLWDRINGTRDPKHIRRRPPRGKPVDHYKATHPPKPGPYSWEANPWVWVVGFSVAEEVARG